MLIGIEIQIAEHLRAQPDGISDTGTISNKIGADYQVVQRCLNRMVKFGEVAWLGRERGAIWDKWKIIKQS